MTALFLDVLMPTVTVSPSVLMTLRAAVIGPDASPTGSKSRVKREEGYEGGYAKEPRTVRESKLHRRSLLGFWIG